ncbi:hypothetical protein AAVH_15040 [Aphelenchoides avenae]|nr:hypothetical protein AAVH_15040 [Aphelenchus avenae]
MVIEDLDAGQVLTGTRSEQDPAVPTDTVSTFRRRCHCLFSVHHHRDSTDQLCRVRLHRVDLFIDRHHYGDVRSVDYVAYVVTALQHRQTEGTLQPEEAEAAAPQVSVVVVSAIEEQ